MPRLMLRLLPILLPGLFLARPSFGQPAAPFSWQRAVLYHVVVERFENGDPSNDHADGRGPDAATAGGVFTGLRQRIEAGAFDAAGIDALLLSPPFAPVHAPADGVEAASGHRPLDFTEPDAALGTPEAFGALVAAAHDHGLRVVLDVPTARAGFPSGATPPVALPAFLREKWGPEKTARETAAFDAFVARTGAPRTPRAYLVHWLAGWVTRYGLDGFFVTGAVDDATRDLLRSETSRALRAWKAAHPDRALDEGDFWLAGEASGFDTVPAPFRAYDAPADTLEARYATVAAAPPRLWHLPADLPAGARLDALTRLLLMPGAVLLSDGDAPPDEAERDRRHLLGTFRRRHPALAGGLHRKLGDSPYAFARTAQVGRAEDRVIVVLGATGRTRLNVSHVFPDDTVLRDPVTGHIALVSYGQVTFPAGGLLLLEEVP